MAKPNFETYDSFAEVQRDLLQAEVVVEEAWESIQSYFTKKLHGTGRTLHPEEVDAFFGGAIAIVGRKYASPAEFRSAIPTMKLTEKIDKQTLFHFAGKWAEREKTGAKIAGEIDSTRAAASATLYERTTGHTNKRLMTGDELKEYTAKIHQRKKDRKRNKDS